MIAGLDDIAVLHDQDQISVTDGGETMGDDKAGAVFHQLVHPFLDQHFRTGIDAAGRLIQDEDLRICQECTGDRQQLLLSL